MTKGETWDLEGVQLTYTWSLAVCHVAGFRGMRLVRAVALMTAESQRYTRAWHKNLDDDGELHSIDRGLFQINDRWHPDLSWTESMHPVLNAEYAAKISSKGHWFKPWAAWTSGAYERYMPSALAWYALNIWRLRVARVPIRWDDAS